MSEMDWLADPQAEAEQAYWHGTDEEYEAACERVREEG